MPGVGGSTRAPAVWRVGDLLSRLRSGRIAAVSASLVGTQAVTSVLGLAYWTIAARSCSVAAVGLAGAAVSLMMLLGSFGMLGLGTLLIAEAPRMALGGRRLFIRTSLVTSGLASAALGLVAAVIIGLLSVSSLGAVATPFNALDFAVGTGLMGLTMVLDQAVLVIGSGGLQLERNTVASAAKIVFLLALTGLGRHSGMDVFLAWTLGTLVSLPLVAYRTRGGRALQESRRLVDLSLLRGLGRAAAGHHVLNLILQAPIQLLSLVVAVVLSAQSNGYFSTARSIAGFVFVLPFSITIGLFATAGGDERAVLSRMRTTVPFGLAASLLADLVLFPLGPFVLGVFGHSYSVDALTTLRVLVLAGLPFVVKDHFVALRRVQGRTGEAAVVALAGAVLEMVAAVVGAHVGGTVGLCTGWVAALTVEAVLLSVPLARARRGLAATAVAATELTTAAELEGLSTASSAGMVSTSEVSPVTRTAPLDETHGAVAHPAVTHLAHASRGGSGPDPQSEPAARAPSPVPAAAGRFLAGPVVLLMSAGLLLEAWAVARGHADAAAGPSEVLWWLGLLTLFVPAAVRILAPRTPAGERVILAVALALLLQVSRIVLAPTSFTFHDEFIHANTLRLIDAHGRLFTTNPLLPVSSAYPGLEVVTAGVQHLTGLSAHASAAVVLVLARLVLVLVVLAVMHRLSGSVRVATTAVLLYACNPQFLFFNSQFSYQSLALPLAGLAVYLVVARREAPGRLALVPAVAVVAAVVVTHHVTSILLVLVFATWWLLELALQRGRPSRHRGALEVMTLVSAVLVLAWTLRPGNGLPGYLRSIGDSSGSDITRLLHGQQTHRLFRNSSGAGSPLWERGVIVASILLVLAALVPALWFSRSWLRRRRSLAVLLCVVAALYPLIPAGHLTAATSEVTDRASGFLFLGVGFVVAWWLAERLRLRGRLLPAGLAGVAAVAFVGGIVFGAGPTATQLPGPFLVSADSRSLDSANLSAAQWLRTSLPPDQRVYADRVAGLLAAAVGRQHTVTHIADKIDASQVLLAPTFTDRDRQLIRQAGIQYVIVDQRDSTDLPAEQVYVESGEYGGDDRTRPVSSAALHKLAAVPGVQRLYDNGALVVYDVRALDAH